jgi:hypothetical protein
MTDTPSARDAVVIKLRAELTRAEAEVARLREGIQDSVNRSAFAREKEARKRAEMRAAAMEGALREALRFFGSGAWEHEQCEPVDVAGMRDALRDPTTYLAAHDARLREALAEFATEAEAMLAGKPADMLTVTNNARAALTPPAAVEGEVEWWPDEDVPGRWNAQTPGWRFAAHEPEPLGGALWSAWPERGIAHGTAPTLDDAKRAAEDAAGVHDAA